ncbi:DUF3048 domain-containing protein [Microlunatus spumicola]|uniref:DUF3048 domain-containing protein n=1 Tax=Microlunatus spumicola TaxID=81499 RepID=UPI00195DC654
MARITRRTALLGAVTAALAACSKDPTPAPAPAAPAATTPSATPVAPTPKPTPVDTRPRWPLTGELLKDKGDARHAAVAVKVPDNRQEHPQRGIGDADIVFVQLEGYLDADGYSSTRLVPVFHSKMPDTVEPVRSIRPVDVPLLSPMDAIIGNTGAAKWTIAYVKKYSKHLEAMLSYLATRGTGSYGTDQSRVYQYQGQTYYDRATTCHPKVLAKQTKRFRDGPPRVYFPIAPSDKEVSTVKYKGKDGRTLKVPYKGDDYLMGYTYDKKTKRYLRSMPWGPHVLADGKRVSTDNVLVIKAHQHFEHHEPMHDIIDTKGTFLYFHEGRYVTGTWRKAGVAEPFRFALTNGEPLLMAPGQTFVELPDTKARLRIGD